MKRSLCIIMNIIVSFVSFLLILFVILFFLGIKPTIVVSGSMEPTLPVGSLCMIDTKYPIENVKTNDIIVYYVKKQKVIHRVYLVRDGIVRTKGDANSNVDRAAITIENYYGKYLFSIPVIGLVVPKLQNSIGKTIFVLVLILIYSFWYYINYSYKKEHNY